MNRRRATALLLSLLAPLGAQAATRTLTYEGHADGVSTRLTLRLSGVQVEGVLEEGALRLNLRAALEGQRFAGQFHEPLLGLALMSVLGELRGDDLALVVQPAGSSQTMALSMRRVGAPPVAAAPTLAATATSGAATTAAGGARDARIVGRWRHESQINSPGGAGGFASFSTVRTLELAPDGSIRQWVRSAGGGGNWSHRAGDELEFSGRWQTRGEELLVQVDGQPDFVPAVRYRLVGERLVTENGQSRRIWQR